MPHEDKKTYTRTLNNGVLYKIQNHGGNSFTFITVSLTEKKCIHLMMVKNDRKNGKWNTDEVSKEPINGWNRVCRCCRSVSFEISCILIECNCRDIVLKWNQMSTNWKSVTFLCVLRTQKSNFSLHFDYCWKCKNLWHYINHRPFNRPVSFKFLVFWCKKIDMLS